MGIYRRWIFPHLLDYFMRQPAMLKERAALLAQAGGEVLEVGFGTGLNLAYYPPAVERVTAIDPELPLAQRVAARRAELPCPLEVFRADGQQLPFDRQRFDCVVTTWTLCTIPDPSRALAEIRRVLRPGGVYLFVEHGRSPQPRTARWQDRLNPLQRVVGVGCNLNRPIDRLVAEAGFHFRQLDRFAMPATPALLATHYRGCAAVD